MKNRAAEIFVLLIALSALLPASAQETEPFLSLSVAIDLAVQKDVRLLPQKTTLRIAQLRQNAPTVWQDPEARFETGLDTREDFFNSALRFYPPHPWQLQAAARETASLTAAAGAEYQMAQAATAADTFLLYRELQCLEKEIPQVELFAGIKKDIMELTEQRVAAAMGTSGEALLLRWEWREAEREVRTLRREYDVLKDRLAVRTGVPRESLHLAPLDYTESFITARPEEACRSALESRPELLLLQAQLKQAEAQLKQAEAEQLPWFNHVQTSYSDPEHEWEVQVAVSLPIFSLGGSKKRQALAEQSLRQTALMFSEIAVGAQIGETLKALARAGDEWAAHRKEQAELAEATRAEIKKLQEFAPSAPAEWLSLEARLAQADRRLLQTLRAVYSAQAELLLATGQPRLIIPD
jgi:outer membrane protein TolC